MHSLSTKRVLTLELIGGVDYATFCDRAPQAERNAAGETLWRFMFRALWKHGLLYADPHPGNYRFLGGGRVAFLDFGCHKQLDAPLVDGMKRYITALQTGDLAEFYRACVEVLGYDPDDPESLALYTEYTKLVLAALRRRRTLQVHQGVRARERRVPGSRREKLVFKPNEALPNLPAPVHMPSDLTFVNRLQWGFASVLAGLGAEANWRRIVEPWLHGPHAPDPLTCRSRACVVASIARRRASGLRARPGALVRRPDAAPTRVVHGENLDAMRRLARAGFAGRFRCVYLDPPFNSGRRFAEYDDALDPGAWRAMMRERLAAARDLMSDDGAIFVEIDDTELGPLQFAMDDVFGREPAHLDDHHRAQRGDRATRRSIAGRST